MGFVPNPQKAGVRRQTLLSYALLSIGFAVSAFAAPESEEKLAAELPAILARAAEHYKALDAAATPLMKGAAGRVQIPRGFKRAAKTLDMRPIEDWTSGHYPGALWYLYEATGDTFFRDRATVWTEALAPLSKYEGNHDIGFMMFCSFGNAQRLMKTNRYEALLFEAAETLSKRYNENLGLIRSWGAANETKNFLVIPDNLMNLELLLYAARCANVPRYAKIAVSHADVTMRNHFREDGGCYHVLDYDQKTGCVKNIQCGQGKSCKTAWARGESWAVYGYTMLFRATGYTRYLDFARKLAAFAMNHPNMPEDGIPHWDYGAPSEERDSSAGAILASALIELSQYVGPPESARYRAFAVKELTALASPAYFSQGDEIGHFLLKHGVGHKPAHSEVDTPLVYGDYYFLEALVRFKHVREGTTGSPGGKAPHRLTRACNEPIAAAEMTFAYKGE